jgi:hypothetical protein
VDHPDDGMPSTDEVVLEWRTISQIQAFDPDLPFGLSKAQWAAERDMIRNRMLVRLKSAVLAFRLPGHSATEQRTVSFKVPASPWQHWKQKHQDAWWLRWFVARRPVRTEVLSETVELTTVWEDYATYPWQTVAPTDPKLGMPNRHMLLHTNLERFS